jgi:Zn finger protein HypA/HybF involved in hydrogenase expression
MRDILIDQTGQLRCPKCGGRNFDAQRSLKAKVMFGVGALLAPKRLKCLNCGEMSKGGNAQPWNDPSITPPPAQDLEKVCPRCAETVKAAAKLCRFCNNEFTDGAPSA